MTILLPVFFSVSISSEIFWSCNCKARGAICLQHVFNFHKSWKCVYLSCHEVGSVAFSLKYLLCASLTGTKKKKNWKEDLKRQDSDIKNFSYWYSVSMQNYSCKCIFYRTNDHFFVLRRNIAALWMTWHVTWNRGSVRKSCSTDKTVRGWLDWHF